MRRRSVGYKILSKIIIKIKFGFSAEPLREEIALQSCRRLIENVTIFKNLPKDVLQSIMKNLKFELYLPNDVIIKAGSQGDCMFFLSSGTVAVLTPTGKEVSSLNIESLIGVVWIEKKKFILLFQDVPFE